MAGLVSASAVPMARVSCPMAAAQHPQSPESSESALSHLSRLSSAHSLASPSRQPASKRHSLYMHSSKPILHHAVTTTTTTAPAPTPAPSRRREHRELSLDDQAAHPVDASATSPLRSLGHLVPHFAEEADTRPRASLTRQTSLPSTSTAGARTASEGDIHEGGFWTLNWSNAVEAVENVLSIAQGLNIPFLPGPEEGGGLDGAPHITSFLKNPLADPSAAPQQPQKPQQPQQAPQQQQPRPAAPVQPFAFVPLPLGPAASASAQRRAALQAELQTMELMLRPKCPWPRQETPRFPLVDDSPALHEDQEPEGVEQELESTSEAEVEAEAAAYARCAWPREAGKAEALASTSASVLTSAASATNPRCAWPRQAKAVAPLGAQGAPVAYARSPWPRTSTKAASTLVAEPETAAPLSTGTPSLATVAALNNLASVALATAIVAQGPRCAWPREKRAGPLGSSPALLEAGPRCAWPREMGAVPATVAAASASSAAGILMMTETAPRCAWPRHQASRPALSSVAPEDALSSLAPRCAWPKVSGPKAILAPAPAAAAAGVFATAPLSDTILGPRCDWPRKAPTTASRAPSPAASQLEITTPRCAWPRRAGVATALGASTPTAVAPMNSEAVAVQMGPRCAWPRPAAAKPLSSAPLTEAPAEAPAMGPRCAWPRVAPAPAPLAAPAAAAAAVPAVEGPRCAWPRKVQVAPPAAPVVAAEEPPAPLGLGPRCPWPRVGAPKASPAPAPAAGPAEDAGWEVLPELAVEEARKRIPLVAAAALRGSSGAGLSIAGPRCAWPRSLKMAKGARGMEA